MKLTTNDSGFDAELRKLAADIRGLEGTEDRIIARRNARQRVLRELRKLRMLLDTKAPAIVKRGEVKRLKTFEGRAARLKRTGWVGVSPHDVPAFAAAGVRVRRIRIHARSGDLHATQEQLFLPAWAVAIGSDSPTKLRQAKKDRKLQRSVVAEAKLKESW